MLLPRKFNEFSTIKHPLPPTINPTWIYPTPYTYLVLTTNFIVIMIPSHQNNHTLLQFQAFLYEDVPFHSKHNHPGIARQGFSYI